MKTIHLIKYDKYKDQLYSYYSIEDNWNTRYCVRLDLDHEKIYSDNQELSPKQIKELIDNYLSLW